MLPTTTIRYSCRPCNLVKVALDVPARGTESVTDWMNATMQHVSTDHRRRSPRCSAKTCDLMIPTTGTDQIGGPVKQ